MNKRRFLLSLTFTSLLFLLPPQAWAFGNAEGLSPFWDWKTLESPHFRVTFPSELEGVARKSADYLEESHVILSQALDWEPRQKTQVIVVDNTDIANGQTAAALRFGMILRLTPPENWFATATYDNWLRYLILHEYTHFLNLDPTSSFFEVLRILYGDSIRPNSVWPRWMVEGLAVYMETRYTQAGRGTSSFYEMILRTAVHEKVFNTREFMTPSRLTDSNPYAPFGETPYLFGYHLMNQVALDSTNLKRNKTADGRDRIKTSDDLFKVLSKRSSGRIPFFINGNLENVTGKNWYQYWDEWADSTEKRMQMQIRRIRRQPLTPYKAISKPGNLPFGSAISRDGKYVAYTVDHADRRRGIVLRTVGKKESESPAEPPTEAPTEERIEDKFFGTSMAFTSDSRFLLYSAVRRKSQYYQWSDLAAYDIQTGETQWLTDSKRAKDPDLSRDGKRVVFTVTETARTGIAIAQLESVGKGTLRLQAPKTLYMPRQFDRASNPKFSPNGHTIVFSLHRNGEVGEHLMKFDLRTRKLSTLIGGRFQNRFPTFDKKGRLYYVSNRTGVDNLYLYRVSRSDSVQLTNLVSGIWFPQFGPRRLYGNVYTSKGWVFAQLKPASKPIQTAKARVPPPPAPRRDSQSRENLDPRVAQTYEVDDYSVFPSIWPRYWGPLLLYRDSTLYFGGILGGFDATDRHRYELLGAYDALTGTGDWRISYSTRFAGPTLGIRATRFTENVQSSGGVAAKYDRKTEASISLSYPFRDTYSQVTPSIAFGMERSATFDPADASEPSSKSRFVPVAETLVRYSNTESSRLGISSERGRSIQLGGKGYFDNGVNSFKALYSHTEYLPLGGHAVVVPQVTGAIVTRRSGFRDANVVISGFSPRKIESFSNGRKVSFDEISLRGYPNTSFLMKAGGVASMELRFPLFRIFEGWGTRPIFFQNLYAFGFGETAYFTQPILGKQVAPSAGGGVRLSMRVFNYVPLTLALDYHRGFESLYGGRGDVFFSALLSSASP